MWWALLTSHLSGVVVSQFCLPSVSCLPLLRYLFYLPLLFLSFVWKRISSLLLSEPCAVNRTSFLGIFVASILRNQSFSLTQSCSVSPFPSPFLCQFGCLTVALWVFLSVSLTLVLSIIFSRPFSVTLVASITCCQMFLFTLVFISFCFSFFQFVCLNLVLSIFPSHSGSGNPFPHMFTVDLVVSTLCYQSSSLTRPLTHSLLSCLVFSRLFSVNTVVTILCCQCFSLTFVRSFPFVSLINSSIIAVVSFLLCKLIFTQLLLLPQSRAVHFLSLLLCQSSSLTFSLEILLSHCCAVSRVLSLSHTHALTHSLIHVLSSMFSHPFSVTLLASTLCCESFSLTLVLSILFLTLSLSFLSSHSCSVNPLLSLSPAFSLTPSLLLLLSHSCSVRLHLSPLFSQFFCSFFALSLLLS